MNDLNRGLAAIISLLWSAFWSGFIFLAWWPSYATSVDFQRDNIHTVFSVATERDARVVATTVAAVLILIGLIAFFSEAVAAFRPKIVITGDEIIDGLQSDLRRMGLEVRELTELIRHQMFAGRLPLITQSSVRWPAMSAETPAAQREAEASATQKRREARTGGRPSLLRRTWSRLRGTGSA